MGVLVQFETSALTLALSIREQIKHQKICITDVFDRSVLVSRLRWLNGWIRADVVETRTILRREPFSSEPIANYLPARRVQLVQAVEVSLSTPAQLQAAGAAEPPALQVLELHLVFSLQIYNVSNNVSLGIGFQDLEGLPDIPAFQDLKSKIAALFPIQKIDLDLGKLTGLNGKPVVANADIAAVASPGPTSAQNPDPVVASSTVAIRFELGAYPVNTADWEAFFGSTETALFRARGKNGYDPSFLWWAMFTDKYFVTENARQQVEDSFKDGQFRLHGGINSAWSAPDGHAVINLDFYGDAVNACDMGILGASDIGMQVNVPIELSAVPQTLPPFVYSPGAMQQNAKVNYWKDDWDTTVCVLGTTLVWPYLGPKLMTEDKLTWIELVLSLLAGPLVSILILKEANKGGKVPAPGATCVRPDSNKDEFVCTKPFDVGFPLGGGLTRLQDYFGRPDGLILLGDVFWTERVSRQFHFASIQAHDFKLVAASLTCSQVGPSGLAWISAHPDWFAGYQANIAIEFEEEPLTPDGAHQPISFSKTDLIPPYICAAQVRAEDDPLNVFRPFVSFDDSGPYTVYIRVPLTSVPDAYFAPGTSYPCRVLIQTSAGARTITIPPIVKPTDEQITSVVRGAWARAVSTCYAKSRPYNPRWIIDPPDLYRVRQLWQIQFTNLRAGEQMIVETTPGRVIAGVRASTDGKAALRLAFSPEQYDGRLTIRGHESEPPSIRRAGRDAEPSGVPDVFHGVAIDIRQIQLVERAAIQASGQLHAAAPFTASGRPFVATVDDNGISAYDISWVNRPRLMAVAAAPGVRGVLAFGKHLLVWGEHGLFTATLNSDLGALELRRVSDAAVATIVASRAAAFVLGSGAVRVLAPNLECEMTLDLKGVRTLAASDSHLLAADGRRLMVYTVSSNGCVRRAGEFLAGDCDRLRWSASAGSNTRFLVERCGKAEVVDVSDPARYSIVGRYEVVDELASSVRQRDVLISMDPSTDTVRLFKVQAAVWV